MSGRENSPGWAVPAAPTSAPVVSQVACPGAGKRPLWKHPVLVHIRSWKKAASPMGDSVPCFCCWWEAHPCCPQVSLAWLAQTFGDPPRSGYRAAMTCICVQAPKTLSRGRNIKIAFNPIYYSRIQPSRLDLYLHYWDDGAASSSQMSCWDFIPCSYEYQLGAQAGCWNVTSVPPWLPSFLASPTEGTCAFLTLSPCSQLTETWQKTQP